MNIIVIILLLLLLLLLQVIRDWEGYNKMLKGAQLFINQMQKMVGLEPKDSSYGNTTLIPTYVAYKNQIQGMAVSYKRLVALGSGLASNPYVENRNVFTEELKDLEAKWEPLKDNVMDTLDLLVRGYNDWIMVKLQHMNDLVTQMQALTQQAESFVQSYPLADIMGVDSEALLKETDDLVANMEKLSALEGECDRVEEQLLDKQIQQETAAGFSGSQSDLESSSTTKEKERVMAAWERVQTDSEALQPVLNVMYLQLQLLQGVQESVEVINNALDFVGTQKECEEYLIKLEERLSSDRFDKLKGQVYDVGTVLEEAQEEAESHEQPACFPREKYDKMLTTNRTLGAKINTLLSSGEEARTRIQVIIQWWEEFHSNYNEVIPWLEGVEVDLNELLRRHADEQSPRYSPIILLQQLKSLNVEVEEKSVVVCAIESTSGNVLEEMSLKGVDPCKIPQQVEYVRTKWEELRERIRHLRAEIEPAAESFQTFLSEMSKFLTWLSTYYAKVYDEFCMKVPQDASQELIGQMMNQLEVFRAELIKKRPDQELVWAESDKWVEFKVPEEVLSELPSPPEISPDPPTDDDEEKSESVSDTPPLPFVKTCMEKGWEKWWRVRQMLEDREAELERCSGSYQLFAQQVQKLLEWLQEQLNMNALADPPPADLGVVEGYHKQVKMTRAELQLKLATLKALQHLGSELRGQVNPATVAHLETMLAKMEQVWEQVQSITETRHEVLVPLVEHLREFTRVSSKFETWLKEKEAELVLCGPIGANLDRCLEQETILAELYEMFMSNKQAPDEVLREVDKIRGLCGAESEAQIRQQVSELEQRFNAMFEDTEERIECCEQAKAGLQKLLKEIRKFEEWVDQMEEVLEKKKQVKRPIGTLQTEMDEHYDFMRDIETHTEDYCVLIPPGQKLMEEYQPNDWLAAVMQTLKDKWFGYVGQLTERECFLASLLHKWEKYEGEVKELLGWIMAEAESFSKDVTTYGEKGIIDHMETCKNFMDVLEGKKDHVNDIEDHAVDLKVEDAEKKNGTSDVESRWNDVQMHWNSSCKLLTETLLHLEATEAEMRHVLQIREEEFEWLEDCELGSALRRRTHGKLELLHQEIERHEGLLQETMDHEEAREFIVSTISFLVEHSRSADREGMAVKAEDFNSRYRKIRDSLEAHTAMLRNSIPFWEKFNCNSSDLQKWLDGVSTDLLSDRVQFGNATVTEQSLLFCQEIQVDINSRNPDLVDMVLLGEELAKYVVPEDLEFITGFVQRLQNNEECVTKETVEKTELLEERLKSWRVFPVEEARVVQEFLDHVKEEEQDGGEAWDDLSSEELLERLEKLESLRELQSSNEDKVQTIDQSARSEDVQRALEKNPDISKERTNLLQGWSNVSGSLKERIMVTKRKAKLVQRLEQEARECANIAQQYQDYMGRRLPPSVLLARSCEDLIDGMVPWHNECRSSLSSFRNVVEEGHQESEHGVTVPKHFDNKILTYQDRFSELADSSAQWKAKIMAIVASWEKFCSDLDELSEWLQSQNMELESLQVVEEFANEFSSHQARLSILKDDFESHRATFTSMVAASPSHVQGEEPEVQDVLRRYTRVETSWHKMDGGITELFKRSKPWVDFTDRFDEFCVWISRLEKKVQNGEREVDEMAEVDGGDLSDKIVLFKGYLVQVVEQGDNLTAVKEGEKSLLPPETCERYEECERLQEECVDVADRWQKMKDRLEQNLHLLDQKEMAWRKHAKSSILLVGRLQQDVEDYERKIRDKDTIIKRLRNAPPPPRPSSPRPNSPICRRCVPVIIVVVVGIALALAFIKKEQTDFRPL